MADPQALLTFNGVNGSTGQYDVEPMTLDAFSQVVLGKAPLKPDDLQHLEELKLKHLQDVNAHYAPKEGVDRKKINQTGWGVIFAFGADPAIREALSPLLQLRKSQAGDLYKEFIGPDAYRPDESKDDFLQRFDKGPGPADPKLVPYYLLIVGDPNTIPFRFQYQLDVQYGVGRIHFDSTDPQDALARYASYANSVVEAESGKLALPRRAAFFATSNPGDAATLLSHDQLATPLAEWAKRPGWTIDKYLGNDATKASLAALLGHEAPAFLFTASHGMCYNNGDTRQLAEQGALLCQEWPGPSYKQPIPEGFFFSGEDVADDAHIFGSIAMHFACFGAGTPQLSDYSTSGPPPAIAPQGFLGRLPQRLIGHPRGGALAVIGHIERAWGYSFSWDKATAQTAVFESTIQRLMEGHPVGSAVEYFNERYAELASDLSTTLEDVKFGKIVSPYKISGLWTANNDARGYSVVGDPAVRLFLAEENKPVDRPVLEVVSAPLPRATVPPSQPQDAFAPPPLPAGAASFGVFGSIHDAAASLQDVAQKIGSWLADTFQNVTTIKVNTYVSDNLKEVQLVNGVLTGADLRAVTIASLDGNTLVCIPEKDGVVDDALWKIHSDIVDKALANRVEMLRTAAAAIASLVPGGKAL